jgi:hypothetical protein
MLAVTIGIKKKTVTAGALTEWNVAMASAMQG